MKQRVYYLTPDGLQKFKEEYERLKRLNREKKLKIKEARDELWRPEDLNPDFEALQTELNLVKERLIKIENILKNAQVIKKSKNLPEKVSLGSTVTAEINGVVDEFTIVGTAEADPSKKKISNESPIGKALLGKRKGEVVTIKTPVLNHTCKILKIK